MPEFTGGLNAYKKPFKEDEGLKDVSVVKEELIAEIKKLCPDLAYYNDCHCCGAKGTYKVQLHESSIGGNTPEQLKYILAKIKEKK